jgi:hypothetical protein
MTTRVAPSSPRSGRKVRLEWTPGGMSMEGRCVEPVQAGGTRRIP